MSTQSAQLSVPTAAGQAYGAPVAASAVRGPPKVPTSRVSRPRAGSGVENVPSSSSSVVMRAASSPPAPPRRYVVVADDQPIPPALRPDSSGHNGHNATPTRVPAPPSPPRKVAPPTPPAHVIRTLTVAPSASPPREPVPVAVASGAPSTRPIPPDEGLVARVAQLEQELAALRATIGAGNAMPSQAIHVKADAAPFHTSNSRHGDERPQPPRPHLTHGAPVMVAAAPDVSGPVALSDSWLAMRAALRRGHPPPAARGGLSEPIYTSTPTAVTSLRYASPATRAHPTPQRLLTSARQALSPSWAWARGGSPVRTFAPPLHAHPSHSRYLSPSRPSFVAGNY